MKYKRLYFAYGSNLNLSQMKQRCPHSKVVAASMLKDYELQFWHVATIVPKKGAEVPILVWEIDQKDECSLDRYEGFPNLYRKELFRLKIGSRYKEGMAYLMNYGSITPPSHAYFSTILKGYKDNGLDTRYLYDALSQAMQVAQSEPLIAPGGHEQEDDAYEELLDDPMQLTLN